MVLGSTKPLTEINTRNSSYGGKGGLCLGLTTFTYSCADCLYTLAGTTSWSLKGLSRPIMDLLSRNISTQAHYFIWQFASILPLSFAWRQEMQRSPLFQPQASRGQQVLVPCFAVNITFFIHHVEGRRWKSLPSACRHASYLTDRL